MDASTVTRLAARGTLVGSVVFLAGVVGFALDGSPMCAGTGCGPPSAWRVVFAVGLFAAVVGATLTAAGKLYARLTSPP